MEHLFSALAFAGLIAAQFFAVVFAAHEHRKVRSSESGLSRARGSADEEYLGLLGMTTTRQFTDEEV